MNNPLRFTDPTGKFVPTAAIVAGAVFFVAGAAAAGFVAYFLHWWEQGDEPWSNLEAQRYVYTYMVASLPLTISFVLEKLGLAPGASEWLSEELVEPTRKMLDELFRTLELYEPEGPTANEVILDTVERAIWFLDFFYESEEEKAEAYREYWEIAEYEAQYKIWLQRNYPEKVPFEQWISGVPSGGVSLGRPPIPI